MGYPSTTLDAKVARCYVCDEVSSKHRMVNVGLDKEEAGKYIFRHDDCEAGSDKWLTHFMHKSTLRALFMGCEGKKMNAEKMRSLGEKIVEKTREKHEKAICDRMDAKRGIAIDVKTANPAVFATVTGRVGVPKKELRPVAGERAPVRVEKGGVSGKNSWRVAKVRRSRG